MPTSREVNSVFLIIFSLIFILNIIINTFYCFSFHYNNICISLIPVIIFALFFLIFKRKNSIALITISSILAFLFMVMVFFNFIVMAFNDGTTVITDIGSYNKVMRIYNYPSAKVVSHFPKTIPSYAKDISFFQIPQFLQGGDEIYLAYSVSNEEFNALTKEYKDKAKHIVSSKGEIDSLGNKVYIPGGVYTTLNINLNEKNDFSIFIIDSVPYEPGNWNHGKSYGTAINKTTGFVLYWFENW